MPELQGLKTLNVAFHLSTKDEVSAESSAICVKRYHKISCLISCLCTQVVIHTIRLPKESTVADVLNDLKTKVIVAPLLLKYLKSSS